MVWDIPDQLGTAFLAVSPPSPLLSPSLLAGVMGVVVRWAEWETRKALMLCSTVQQCQNHWYAINTVSVTNPKHSSILAAMKEVNSTPGRPSTILLPMRHTWALNLAYCCLVSFPVFIICPEQMTYLLSEAATMNSPLQAWNGDVH